MRPDKDFVRQQSREGHPDTAETESFLEKLRSISRLRLGWSRPGHCVVTVFAARLNEVVVTRSRWLQLIAAAPGLTLSCLGSLSPLPMIRSGDSML